MERERHRGEWRGEIDTGEERKESGVERDRLRGGEEREWRRER